MGVGGMLAPITIFRGGKGYEKKTVRYGYGDCFGLWINGNIGPSSDPAKQFRESLAFQK